MHNHCPCCKNPLMPWYQWKAGDGRFYCNEFCADASDVSGDAGDMVPSAPQFRETTAPRT